MADDTRETLKRIIDREPRTIDEQMWQEGFRLGREQGTRETHALVVSALTSIAAKRAGEGDHLGSYIVNLAAEKIEQMKFLDTRTGETMPGYASHLLEKYLRETRGTEPPKDALDQYQIEMLRYWCSHLEHVLMDQAHNFIRGRQQVEEILREFLYGAVPHPHDAMERERLATLARDAIGKTTRTRYTPEPEKRFGEL